MLVGVGVGIIFWGFLIFDCNLISGVASLFGYTKLCFLENSCRALSVQLFNDFGQKHLFVYFFEGFVITSQFLAFDLSLGCRDLDLHKVDKSLKSGLYCGSLVVIDLGLEESNFYGVDLGEGVYESGCGQKVEYFSDVEVVCDFADEFNVVGDLKKEQVVLDTVGEES